MPSTAEMNDQARKNLSCVVMMTSGVASLNPVISQSILKTVQRFDDFNADNDPYGEHDFGAFRHPVAGKIFWKIDYYDRDLKFGAADPADADNTRRVLTVMLASEY